MKKWGCIGRICSVLVKVFKWLGARCVLSAPSKRPILKRRGGGRETSQIASHTAGQGLSSSPLVCSSLRRAFTRDGRNTKRAEIDFLQKGGVGGRIEQRLLEGGGLDCPHQTPLPSSHSSLLLSSSSSHLLGSGGTLCLSARQWSVSLQPHLLSFLIPLFPSDFL